MLEFLNNKIPRQSTPHPILTQFVSPFPFPLPRAQNTQPILLRNIKE